MLPARLMLLAGKLASDSLGCFRSGWRRSG